MPSLPKLRSPLVGRTLSGEEANCDPVGQIQLRLDLSRGFDPRRGLEDLVLPRMAGSSMGHACPVLRVSENFSFSLGIGDLKIRSTKYEIRNNTQ